MSVIIVSNVSDFENKQKKMKSGVGKSKYLKQRR